MAAALNAAPKMARVQTPVAPPGTRNVNLRREQSSADLPIRLLTPAEPPMELLEPHAQDGYFYVRTTAAEEGYVWTRSVRVSAAPPTGGVAPSVAGAPIQLHPGVPGSRRLLSPSYG